MSQTSLQTITLNGRKIDYRLVESTSARKLRIRGGLNGVEVVLPLDRNGQEVETFLQANQAWILDQLARVEQLRSIRKPKLQQKNEMLFRGVLTPVYIEDVARRKNTNKVLFENGAIVVVRAARSNTALAKSLENWLRGEARQEIFHHLDAIITKWGKQPNKIYVMGQKTKWGNCSSLQNLSFNWRLILAPDFVLKYIVTHEVVHLEVPDHSQRFWLTLQSLCPDMDRARQWLVANSDRLMIDLNDVC
ncbi:MAG TPA: SprT family zinc-dependent metalloprotease [Anaerolineae bacterium]|nr:SprT family zinc-dependent metalloprotease [Anaerolineae bacterium]